MRKSIIWTISKEELQEIFNQEQTLKGTLARIGLSYGGTSATALRSRLSQEEIDFSCIYGNNKTIVVCGESVVVRTCSCCGKDKRLSEFGRKRKRGYNAYCKDCNKDYNKKHYKEKKEEYLKVSKARKNRVKAWLRKYKLSRSCARCGESHYACLDFHHRNPEKKEFSVSQMVGQGYSEEKILREIAKCDVLCANCHRKLHAEED